MIKLNSPHVQRAAPRKLPAPPLRNGHLKGDVCRVAEAFNKSTCHSVAKLEGDEVGGVDERMEEEELQETDETAYPESPVMTHELPRTGSGGL